MHRYLRSTKTVADENVSNAPEYPMKRRSQRLAGQKRRFGTSLTNIEHNERPNLLGHNNPNSKYPNSKNNVSKDDDCVDPSSFEPDKKRCRYNLRSRANPNLQPSSLSSTSIQNKENVNQINSNHFPNILNVSNVSNVSNVPNMANIPNNVNIPNNILSNSNNSNIANNNLPSNYSNNLNNDNNNNNNGKHSKPPIHRNVRRSSRLALKRAKTDSSVMPPMPPNAYAQMPPRRKARHHPRRARKHVKTEESDENDENNENDPNAANAANALNADNADRDDSQRSDQMALDSDRSGRQRQQRQQRAQRAQRAVRAVRGQRRQGSRRREGVSGMSGDERSDASQSQGDAADDAMDATDDANESSEDIDLYHSHGTNGNFANGDKKIKMKNNGRSAKIEEKDVFADEAQKMQNSSNNSNSSNSSSSSSSSSQNCNLKSSREQPVVRGPHWAGTLGIGALHVNEKVPVTGGTNGTHAVDAAADAVDAWDRMDVQNELCVVEYVNDILRYLKVKEMGIVREDYMQKNGKINYRMRTILMDWLISVHRKFRLEYATLFLTDNILDRYLSVNVSVGRDTLQLVGCAAMWIASKYHDIYAPEASDFVYISDNAFNVENLIESETDILSKLNFDLCVPTTLSFAERFVKIAVFELKLKRQIEPSKIVENLVYYLIEHTLMDYEHTYMFAPSKIAAASLAYAGLALNLFSHWPKHLADATSYSLEELLPVMVQLDKLRRNAKHSAVNKKYSHQNYGAVASLKFDNLHHRQHLQNYLDRINNGKHINVFESNGMERNEMKSKTKN